MSNNQQHFFTELQEEYIIWGVLIISIISILTILISSTINQDTLNTKKQKEQCDDYDGTKVYFIDQENHCFTKEIILENYYNEYVK